MSSLCDSNSISELMKPEPHEKVDEWFSHQEFIFLSVVTVEEIYYGLTDARKKWAWFENFLQYRCEILPVTTDIAKQCAKRIY